MSDLAHLLESAMSVTTVLPRVNVPFAEDQVSLMPTIARNVL